MLSRAGHVGLWAGLYVAAALVCLAQLAGLWAPGMPGRTWAILFVLFTAVGAYSLDRVKLRDRWMDPADALAQPERYQFLSRHSRAVRAFALAFLAGGGAAGLGVTHWAPVASLLALVGVALYAPRPRGEAPRLKDILWIKNAYVALGIMGFTGLVAVATASRSDGPAAWLDTLRTHAAAIACAAALVFARVWIDAAICDLDDEHADRAHGTATLPTTLGGPRTWILTGLLRPVLAFATFACPWLPAHPRFAWALAVLLGSLLLRVGGRPQRVRDLVDVRLAVEAVCVAIALYFWA